MTHAARIIDLSASFTGAMARFVARIEGASPTALEKTPAEGGWSAAQIAWHVAATNEAFAGLIDGSIPHARPPAPDFHETPWSAIAEKVPVKLDAPQQFQPPATVGAREVIERLRASQGKVTTALAGLPEARAGYTVKSTVGTPITLYQVGIWAAAHVARHNAQAKRVLGR